VDYLTGKDYPDMCDTCKDAINKAHMIIVEMGPGDEYADDPEGPSMFAYDRGWFCGGHESLCGVEIEEPEEEKFSWIAWVWDSFRKNGAYHDRYVRTVAFDASYTDALWLFRQIAEELGFKHVRRDGTQMGGSYVDKSGRTLIMLEDFERPESHFEYGSLHDRWLVVRNAPLLKLNCMEAYNG